MTEFVPTLRADLVPPESGLCVEVGRRSVAVFRVGDQLHALDDMCPHSGGPLSESKVEDGCVVCPWHGARFELSTGRSVGEFLCSDVRRHATRIVDGVLEIELARTKRPVAGP